jgi:hypothetical protein
LIIGKLEKVKGRWTMVPIEATVGWK